MTPTRFPLSDAQVNTQVADWTYNGHTGYRLRIPVYLTAGSDFI